MTLFAEFQVNFKMDMMLPLLLVPGVTLKFQNSVLLNVAGVVLISSTGSKLSICS